MTRSRVLRRGAGGWDGVIPTRYGEGEPRGTTPRSPDPPAPVPPGSGPGGSVSPSAREVLEPPSRVVRHVLVGRDPDDAVAFETRYFEVDPGGATTLERHAHAHVVLVLRGRGEVRLGDRWEAIGPSDVVYVAPWELHRFRPVGDEPLGFVCIVDRDRPGGAPGAEGGPSR